MFVPTPLPSPATTSTSGNGSASAMPTSGHCGSGLCACGEFTVTEHLADWTHYTQALAVLWPIKTALAAVAAFFGTEPVLMYWLVGMWAADWIFGVWEAFRRRKLSCRVFKRGAMKFPSYGLCFILVAGVDTCIESACHIELPILECFVAYLAIQESISVVGHMVRLGFQVPPFVLRILKRGQATVEKKVDDLLEK